MNTLRTRPDVVGPTSIDKGAGEQQEAEAVITSIGRTVTDKEALARDESMHCAKERDELTSCDEDGLEGESKDLLGAEDQDEPRVERGRRSGRDARASNNLCAKLQNHGGSHAAQEHVTTGIVENGKKEEFRAVSA